MTSFSVTITSDHSDAKTMLRRALENYAGMAHSHAVQKMHRPLHPGETREKLANGAKVLEARAEAMSAMANQIPGGKAGPPIA